MINKLYKEVHILTPMKTPKKRCELDVVFSLLKQGLTKKEVSKRLNLKPSALSNHLRRLEEKGLIERHGKYLIKINPSSHYNPRVTRNQFHKKLNKRGHAHSFKITFPQEKSELIDKSEVINEFLKKKIEKLSFGSLKLKYKRNTIWINKKSLTIYSNNSYYSDNALHSKFRALKDIDTIIKYLKLRFNIRGSYGIEIFREHYALTLNKFAEWLLDRGEKLDVRNKGNKSILWVDDSKDDDIGLKEFESTDPLRINKSDKLFKEHEETNWEVTPKFLLKSLGKITKNFELTQNEILNLKQENNQIKQGLSLQKNIKDINPPGYIR